MSRRKTRNKDAEIFGQTIRRLRLERGMTQEQLAEAANLNVSYIGFIERGENVPTLTIVLDLAQALEIEPKALLSDVIETRRHIEPSKRLDRG